MEDAFPFLSQPAPEPVSRQTTRRAGATDTPPPQPTRRANGRIDFGRRGAPPGHRPAGHAGKNPDLADIYRWIGLNDQTDENTKVEVVLAYRQLEELMRTHGLEPAVHAPVPFYAWNKTTLRQIYLEAARRWHPDHNANPADAELFKKIAAAWQTIRLFHGW